MDLLRYAAKFYPFLSFPPRQPLWHNPRKGRDQNLPSGNLALKVKSDALPLVGLSDAITRDPFHLPLTHSLALVIILDMSKATEMPIGGRTDIKRNSLDFTPDLVLGI